MTLPDLELRRLLKLNFQKKHKTRILGVVELLKLLWVRFMRGGRHHRTEIVRLKFEGDAAFNMERMHEILELSLGHALMLVRKVHELGKYFRRHWVLLVINLKEDKVYYLDPLRIDLSYHKKMRDMYSRALLIH